MPQRSVTTIATGSCLVEYSESLQYWHSDAIKGCKDCKLQRFESLFRPCCDFSVVHMEPHRAIDSTTRFH